MAEFAVLGIRGSPLCSKVLRDLHKQCQFLPELESLCLYALHMLESLHDEVAQMEEKDRLRKKYVQSLMLLRKVVDRKPLLVRIAKCDTFSLMIQELLTDLEVVGREFGHEDLAEWTNDWESSRYKQLRTLSELLEKASDVQIRVELTQEIVVQEIAVTLKKELHVKRLSEDQLQLMGVAWTRIENLEQMKNTMLVNWFISMNDLVLDDAPIGVGTFGEVYRATWYHDGEIQKVVVKRLLTETSGASRDTLVSLLTDWHEKLLHKNILKLYGGCHIGLEQFFVCEDIRSGNLTDFFSRNDLDEALFKSMFFQVAAGLECLHKHGRYHGSLTCNNILVDGDTPKLSDFGFESIRSLSMSLSVCSHQSQSQISHWKPQEMFDESNAGSIESSLDIYSLGVCMMDALQRCIRHGDLSDPSSIFATQQNVLQARPDNVSDDTWAFVLKLTAPNHRNRPTLSGVLAHMRTECGQNEDLHAINLIAFPSPNHTNGNNSSLRYRPTDSVESFPVPLPSGIYDSRLVLANLPKRCRRMPESEGFCKDLLERLRNLHDPVARLNTNDRLKAEYISVMVRLVRFLRHNPLLERLGSSETNVYIINAFHESLKHIGEGLELDDQPQMTLWETRWQGNLNQHYEKLRELVTQSTDQMLVSEFSGKRRLDEALKNLRSGLVLANQYIDMRELKQATLQRVLNYSRIKGLHMFDWFIAVDDIDISSSHFGTWIRDGVRIKVTILEECFKVSEDAFVRRLKLWRGLDNGHILKLYGGSYVGSSPFYVCEYAPHGNFYKFLGDIENRGMLWLMFLQVAQGLQYLHSQGIVHGELMRNNIYVCENYIVKIAAVLDGSRASSMSASLTSLPDIRKTRWSPKEVVDGEMPSFASDVYSLGMCMIEAITQDVPLLSISFDDEEAIEKIIAGEMPDRPERASDSAWSLICRLCNPDYTARPTLDIVIAGIKELIAEDEQFVGEPSSHDSVCPNDLTEMPLDDDEPSTEVTTISTPFISCLNCEESSIATENWCRTCGFSLEKHQRDIARHSLTKYLATHSGQEIWCKLYEAAIALQDLHDRNIIHGDLKPVSIRIGRDGIAHLCGFEFSKRVSELQPTSKCLKGVRWQAPECLRGEVASFAADVFSFGMCIIYCVSGTPPWSSALSDEEVKIEVCEKKALPSILADLKDDQEQLVRGMCCYDSLTRLQLSEVVTQLAKIATTDDQTMPLKLENVEKLSITGTTSFVTCYVGRWGDAVVALHEMKESYYNIGRSFQSAAELWFSLKHPNVLQLFGVHYGDNNSFFVSEDVKSWNLEMHLSKIGSNVQNSSLWGILRDVACAVRYLHSINVVHGDLGPHSICIGYDGRAKLSGFIFSSEIQGSSPETEPTTEDEWVPPTCPEKHSCTSFASDVYWLGQCIVQVFSGKLSTAQSVFPRCDVCSECTPYPTGLSPAGWELVSKMCCKDPAERVEMAEVVEQLARIAAVSGAIEMEVKTLSTLPIDDEDLPGIETMVLDTVLRYEKESELMSTSVAVPVEELAEYAALEILQGDIKEAVKNYRPQAACIYGRKCMPGDLTPRKPSLKWVLRHEEVMQKRDGDIASGAFARVYRGLWLGVSVALKKVVKVGLAQEQALREEVNIWYKLRHPNIVSLYGACCEEHQLFVCELIDGMPLSSCIHKKVPELDIWRYLHDAAVGLQGLHWYKIVHADLKGNNIMVTPDGRAKLIDFGLSCLQSVDGGAALGAPRWKAPECLNGQGPTFESDIFSLGMCIIEALTGKNPWGNDRHDLVVKAEVKKGLLPNKPKNFSPAQWELVLRMCSFKPEDRLRLDEVIKVLGVFAGRSSLP